MVLKESNTLTLASNSIQQLNDPTFSRVFHPALGEILGQMLDHLKEALATHGARYMHSDWFAAIVYVSQ